MRDRLKAVENPFEIIDQIARWQTDHVGQSYRSGYKRQNNSAWLKTSKLTLVVSDSICSYFSDVFPNPRALINQMIERLTQRWPSKFPEKT